MRGFLKILDKISWSYLLLIGLVVFGSCGEKKDSSDRVGVMSSIVEAKLAVIPGAENTAEYYSLLQGKNVAMVVNQTSRIGEKHLVDSLLGLNIDVKKIFAPEHGFRGEADA